MGFNSRFKGLKRSDAPARPHTSNRLEISMDIKIPQWNNCMRVFSGVMYSTVPKVLWLQA